MQKLFRTRRLALAGLCGAALAACDNDPSQPEISERLVVTVNSVGNTLSLVPLDGGTGGVREVSLGAQGTPVDLAVRGATAVVPMGTYPFAFVVDLRAGQVVHRVALPQGSGATGVAFLNDTLALVANSDLNTVSPVRTRGGAAGAQIATGVFPHAIVAHEGRAFVLNGNLVNFQSVGTGSVTVLNSRLEVVKTVPVSGRNPSAGVVSGDRLYVLNSGTFTTASGSVSVIDLRTLTEVQHYTGFGLFPTSIAADDDGLLYVGGYQMGVVVFDPRTEQFQVPLAQPLKPGGSVVVADLDFDARGRLHVTDSRNCVAEGVIRRLAAPPAFALEREQTVGVCPAGLEFADIPEQD